MVQPNDESKQQPPKPEQSPAPAAGGGQRYPGNLDKAAGKYGINVAAIEAQTKTAGQLQDIQGKPEGAGVSGDKVQAGGAGGVHDGAEGDTKEDINGVSKSPDTPADGSARVPGHDSPAPAAADGDTDEQFSDDEYLDPASFAFSGGGGGTSTANSPAGNNNGGGDPGEYDRARQTASDMASSLFNNGGVSAVLPVIAVGVSNIPGVGAPNVTIEDVAIPANLAGAIDAGINWAVSKYFNGSERAALEKFMPYIPAFLLLYAVIQYGFVVNKVFAEKRKLAAESSPSLAA